MVSLNIEYTNRVYSALALGSNSATMQKACQAAGTRAAQAARTTGSKAVREVYTIKGKYLKRGVSITHDPWGAVLHVSGPMNLASRFKSRLRKKAGVFVSIKKGSGGVVPRSFRIDSRNTFFKRLQNKEAYPIEVLYGPSNAQMYGSAGVLEEMQTRGAEVFESRLAHEVERRIAK